MATNRRPADECVLKKIDNHIHALSLYFMFYNFTRIHKSLRVTPDGRMLGDNPGFIRAIAALNRQVNPVSTLVPAGGSDPAASIGERLAEIRKLQGYSSSDYWRGPKADGLQREYLELLTAQEKTRGR